MKKLLIVFLSVMIFSACAEPECELTSDDLSGVELKKKGKKHPVPFKSKFVTWGLSEELIWGDVPGPPIGVHATVQGEGKASHMGITEIYIDQIWYFGYPMTGTSTITLTAANGAKAIIDFEGINYPNETNTYFEISGTGDFEGGDGRFEFADGDVILEAIFDKSNVATGEGETVITGEIMY